LNLFNSYKNVFLSYLKFFLTAIFLGTVACSSTKYVPEDKYLLNKYSIENENKELKVSELRNYIKPKPNKRILGFKFHLSLYNLSKKNKDNWFNNWLRTIGEAPVLYDKFQTQKTKKQLKSFLSHKGYFNAIVTDSVTRHRKKANVEYTVATGEPYTIRNIFYQFEDTTISSYVKNDTLNSLIKRGDNYDVDVLQDERIRIETLLKDQGYYNFSKEYIYYEADSTLGYNQLDLFIGIKMYKKEIYGDQYEKAPHIKYRINNIYVFTDFNPQEALVRPEEYFRDLDTLIYNGLYLISKGEHTIVNHKVITQSNYLKKGDQYNLTNVMRTHSHLSSLKLFRLVNIQFNELNSPEDNSNDEYLLDCNIQLTPSTLQSYTIELEGTNSAGNLGGAVNLLYQHRNLLHGAENFNLKFKGAFETLTEEIEGFRNTLEYGVEAGISLPKFLFPFMESERFVKKYNPKTSLSLAYNFQRRPNFTRTVANVSFGYNWQSSGYSSHIIRLADINAVKLFDVDSAFRVKIDTTSYLAYSYNDVMITGINYSYIFNNQKIKKKEDFIFFRFNVETAGNLLTSINNITNDAKLGDSYRLLGLEYAQFFKGDIDFRYHRVLNEANDIVYRVFIGVGYPYGNSKAIPFEKQYFGGGANGVRAWHVRSLGPGSYDYGKTTFLNQTADIKIETNLEYRFKLLWVLEGALFVDVGNIWAIKREEDRPGSLFEWNKFHKDLAVGAGLGMRFDFNFFIFRLDMGFKIRDPKYNNRAIWIFGRDSNTTQNEYYRFVDNMTLHLGIGYPF
jgi:outer membrane protein assembly factor BamA